MIGTTALPDASPYFAVLMYGGAAAVLIGFAGLIALLVFRPKHEDHAMRERPKKSSGGPVGLKLGPGANKNTFVGFRIFGFQTAIENEGDENHFEDFEMSAPEPRKPDVPKED